MITTAEAAKILGITKRRVSGLIAAGQITATKASGVWLIDEASVRARADVVNKNGGRPPKGSRDYEQIFTLMNRTHKVADFVYNTNAMVFTDLIRLYDTTRAPLGVDLAGKSRQAVSFNPWWRGRGIPLSRSGLDEKLQELGVSLPEELLYKSLGLSLSDQYWINPAETPLKWQDVNFFNNSFKAAAMRIGQPENLTHPDNTSDGNLPKHWVARGKSRVLLKGAGVLNQEPYNEAVATALYSRQLAKDHYVPYKIVQQDGRVYSECKTFVRDDEEFVPATYVMATLKQPAHHNNYQHFIECCAALGINDVATCVDEMLVCDELIANTDRHNRNFGIIRNVDTLKCRMAPIFDSGTSLWCNVPDGQLPRATYEFDACTFGLSPSKRMLSVTDFSWVNTAALDDFAQDVLSILSENPSISERMDFLENAILHQIDRIKSICKVF